MARFFKSVNKGSVQLDVFYGWDIDVKEWFIDIKMTGFSGGNLTTPVVITLTGSNLTPMTTNYSVNFEISESQQTDVILQILQYAGIVIRDPQIVQVAAQKIQQEEVNEKS